MKRTKQGRVCPKKTGTSPQPTTTKTGLGVPTTPAPAQEAETKGPQEATKNTAITVFSIFNHSPKKIKQEGETEDSREDTGTPGTDQTADPHTEEATLGKAPEATMAPSCPRQSSKTGNSTSPVGTD